MRSSSDNPLEIELLEEKATSYFATVKKMQAALREFDQAGAGQRSELLAEAAERVWFFLVQREAMRLPFYKTIFADFEIPPEVQARIGPKRSSLPS